MATLPEQAIWTEGIYQLETSDPVMGGADGVDNRQAKELANRTLYLKHNLNNAQNNMQNHVDAINPHLGTAPLESPIFTGIPVAPTPINSTNNGQIATTAFVQNTILQGAIILVNDIPTEKLSDVIFVKSKQILMIWVSTHYYTGYRSPECGRIVYGHTPDPLPFELSLTGDVIVGANYPGLVARFKESGKVKPAAQYLKGEMSLWDVGGGSFRLPNLSDMFLRFTGTDADNANVRQLGSYQGDAIRNITGSVDGIAKSRVTTSSGAISHQLTEWSQAVNNKTEGVDSTNTNVNFVYKESIINFDASRVVPVSADNHPMNTSLAPRIIAF